MENLNSQKLKDAMIKGEIGVTGLARATNIQASRISQYLKRKCKIQLPTLAKLAKALNVTPQELITD